MMAEQKMRRLNALALLCILPLFFYSTPQSSDTALVKLDKDAGTRIPADHLRRIKGLEELSASWLVEMPRIVLSDFVRKRIPFQVLDLNPQGKAYFLVSTPKPGQAEDLKKFGSAIVLDEHNCLFWSDAAEAREILPPEFEIKRLALDNNLPLVFGGRSAQAPLSIGRNYPRAPFVDPLIPALISQVSKGGLTNSIQSLQSFQTRYASTANCEAAGTFLYGFFSQLGLPCEYDPFTFSSSSSSRNVVATLLGRTSPQREVIVCAHYDSTSDQRATLAPGADDNASGTAAVMEIARILANYSFDYTIKFIGFSAEEWGLYGSKHYAQEAKSRGEKIMAVINLDMIAYTDRLPEDLDVIVNQTSEWLANRYIIMAKLYGLLDIAKSINPSLKYSDHSSFWDQGYSASLGIEDYPLDNPYYHRTSDTLSVLNLDFAVAVTKVSLAVAADLAQPIGWRESALRPAPAQ